VLYDPRRRWERALAGRLVDGWRAACPGLRARRNAPYRGDADGLTTTLRRHWADRRYAGLELELNQSLATSRDAAWRRLRARLADVLLEVVGAAPAR